MAKDSDFLKRLEAMNGAPLEHAPLGREGVRRRDRTASSYRGARPRSEVKSPAGGDVGQIRSTDSAAKSWAGGPAAPLALGDGVTGVEMADSGWGRAFLIVRPALELDGGAPASHLLRNALTIGNSALCRRLARGFAGASQAEMVFLDLETTGLGDTPLFLGGLMVWEDDALVVRQYLARSFAEEAAVVWSLLEEVGRRKLLVTFNGKSFDWPYVRNRAAAHGISCRPEPAHLDVLLEARRVWRGRGPDCKLQTLESAICGRQRVGDIEGRAVPQAYHDYVRTGDATQIVQILMHNALDLITLAELMARLPAEVGG